MAVNEKSAQRIWRYFTLTSRVRNAMKMPSKVTKKSHRNKKQATKATLRVTSAACMSFPIVIIILSPKRTPHNHQTNSPISSSSSSTICKSSFFLSICKYS
uniref:Uncharacterized protein n=1 Tax=Salix viminalis TaxID=40686 RepID=A0A6N2JYZ8_SALVM